MKDPEEDESIFTENNTGDVLYKRDIVLAQGVFEYVGDLQNQKFAEIAQLLDDNGRFVVSYVNFDHRDRKIYRPCSNVQPPGEFRSSEAEAGFTRYALS